MRDYYSGGQDGDRSSWVEQLDQALAVLGWRLVWVRLTSGQAQRISAAARVPGVQFDLLAGRIVRDRWCDHALQRLDGEQAGAA